MTTDDGQLTTDNPELKNLHEVSRWLDGQGWKVSRATLYKHAKDGRIRPDEHGVFPAKSVERYAIQWLKKKTDAEKVKAEKLAEEERKEKIKYQVALRKREEMKYSILEGRYILRDQLYLELASRAAVLDAGIKATVQLRAEEWVTACGGDQSRIAQFIRSMLADMEDLVNSFSTTRQFQVMFNNEEIREIKENAAIVETAAKEVEEIFKKKKQEKGR